jgi:hypothetical protein
MGTGDQMKLNIDLSKCESIKCKCGNEGFVNILFLRRVPALLSPTATDAVATVQAGYICSACGEKADLSKKKEEEKSNIIQLTGKKE